MRKTLLIAVATLCAAVTTHAQQRNENRMLLHQKDGSTVVYAIDDMDSITFAQVANAGASVEVASVDGTTATVNCTLQKSCKKCYVAAVPDDGSVADIKTYILQNHQHELTESGTVQLAGLKGGTKYKAAVLPFDQYGITTDIATASFATEAADMFDISIDDITWGDAKVTIAPVDKTMKYYYYSMTMEKVNSIANGIDGLAQFDRDFWSVQANMYGCDINEIIQSSLVSGDQTFRTSEAGTMARWNSEVVVYCYGIDAQGNASTPVMVKTFTTTSPVPSSNEFSVTIDQAYPNGVKATITPTNDDTYFVAVQRKRFTDFYEGKLDSMAYVLLQSSYQNEGQFHSGAYTTSKDEYYLNANQDYNIIVFGYNNGLSTPVTMIPFKTPRSSSSAISRFEDAFCDDNGQVDTETLTDKGDKTWAYTIESASEPCELFTTITGITASIAPESSAPYSYTYDSGDNACKLTLTGTSGADANGTYATMEVAIADHPEIAKIVFVGAAKADTATTSLPTKAELVRTWKATRSVFDIESGNDRCYLLDYDSSDGFAHTDDGDYVLCTVKEYCEQFANDWNADTANTKKITTEEAADRIFSTGNFVNFVVTTNRFTMEHGYASYTVTDVSGNYTYDEATGVITVQDEIENKAKTFTLSIDKDTNGIVFLNATEWYPLSIMSYDQTKDYYIFAPTYYYCQPIGE